VAALVVLAIVGVGRLLRERTGAAAGPRA